jgi:hypothetical protein
MSQCNLFLNNNQRKRPLGALKHALFLLVWRGGNSAQHHAHLAVMATRVLYRREEWQGGSHGTDTLDQARATDSLSPNAAVGSDTP